LNLSRGVDYIIASQKTTFAKQYTIMETERLILRSFTPDDWRDLHEYLSQEAVVRFEPYEAFTEEAAKQEAERRSRDGIYFKTDEAGNPIWADTYVYGMLADEWQE
jgi:RimJ/RimL family protein N-acetyltransferase